MKTKILLIISMVIICMGCGLLPNRIFESEVPSITYLSTPTKAPLPISTSITQNENLDGNTPLTSKTSDPVNPIIQNAVENHPINLDFVPHLLNKSQPENGWVNYAYGLAVKNNNNSSINFNINISNGADFQLPEIVFDYDNAYILTKEGSTYPLTIKAIGHLTLPPGLLITGFPDPIVIAFKVPEKLTPTQIVLSPGLAYVDLTKLTDYLNSNGTFDKTEISIPISDQSIPTFPNDSSSQYNQSGKEVNLSEQIIANLPGNVSGKFNRVGGQFNFQITNSIQLTNKDITNDQKYDLHPYLIDKNGKFFNAQSCSSNLLNPIGPGQEVTIKYCFYVPLDDAKPPQEYFLSYYWENGESTFKTPLTNFESCNLSSSSKFMENVNRYHTVPKLDINVPDSSTFTPGADFQSNYGVLWTIHAPVNKEIAIKMIYQQGRPSSLSEFNIVGPDGNFIPQTLAADRSTLTSEVNFFTFCDGPYYALIYMDAGYQLISSLGQ